MLSRIVIHNYALIKELDIHFSKALVIITGETGAGKSILLGALNLILGSRADTSALLDKSKKCIVEAEFDLKEYDLNNFFADNELDYADHTFIRREINAEGKSRAFINDTPVNLNVLRQLALQLVDIHSQRDSLALIDATYQMHVVDAFAKNEKKISTYQQQHAVYKNAFQQLNELVEKEKVSKNNLDYLQFQLTELDAAALQYGEQEKTEQELETLNNAEEIKQQLVNAYANLNNENGLLTNMRTIVASLKSIGKYNDKFAQLAERVESCHIELKDITNEIENAEQEINFDADRIDFLNERLNLIYKLQKKHQLQTIDELITLHNKLAEEVDSISSLDAQIEKQQQLVTKEKTTLQNAAVQLSEQRAKVIPSIESKLQILLKELAMPDARLKIELQTDKENFHSNGIDEIQFLFSANKGHDFKSISKVASGGELSRVMLCLKALTAEVLQMPTMIFDEIDTGVSGEVALKVGKMMAQIAREHQVIAITHLPQIAAKGNSHLFVYKQLQNNLTTTKIKELKEEERIVEIAKMIGGDKYSQSAEANAREMMMQKN
ncbi:MAG: DNA repair protein RecN [Bacteroidia bacterium]